MPAKSTLARIGAAFLAVAVLVYAFLAYWVVHQHGAVARDGLGRMLTPSHPLLRSLLDAGSFWPGPWWTLVDLLWFCGASYGAVALLTWAGERD